MVMRVWLADADHSRQWRHRSARQRVSLEILFQRLGSSLTAISAEDLGRGHAAAGGSFDTGDSTTTNLHVANLPINVTANTIGMHFAQYGPVASVKIMWPREEGGVNLAMQGSAASVAARRAGLNGFIAFMKRKDAEQALEKCDGIEWGGSILRLGWGKSMPLPPRPSYGRSEARTSSL